MMQMVGYRPGSTKAIAARLVLVAALVLAAFAHRPAAPTPSGMTALELARYVLPDGSLPVLCLPGEDRGASSVFCEFCLIAGGAMPSGPASGPCRLAHDATIASAISVRAGPLICPVCHGTASPRGPPARLV